VLANAAGSGYHRHRKPPGQQTRDNALQQGHAHTVARHSARSQTPSCWRHNLQMWVLLHGWLADRAMQEPNTLPATTNFCEAAALFTALFDQHAAVFSLSFLLRKVPLHQSDQQLCTRRQQTSTNSAKLSQGRFFGERDTFCYVKPTHTHMQL
jgi:hypothetical protein